MKSVGITYRETCWIRNNIIIFVESSTTVCLTIHNLQQRLAYREKKNPYEC